MYAFRKSVEAQVLSSHGDATCLYSLTGIPCLYYGTEQGLHGSGSDAAAREALWGGPGFDDPSDLYQHIQQIAAQQPALRYGRLYFRPLSGMGRALESPDFRMECWRSRAS